MAVIKNGWLKGIVNGVSTRLYAHTHSDLCVYGDPANGVTVTKKIDELNSNLGNKAATGHKHKKSDITDFPTSLPASDVYAWAKASSKPSYTASEVGAAASNHTHSGYAASNHNHDSRYYTEAEINNFFNGYMLPNLVYFDDTKASNVTDLLRKKCILALSKGNGAHINYGGWSGTDFGVFFCQTMNNEVRGIYIATHDAWRVSYFGGSNMITYARLTDGNEISSY